MATSSNVSLKSWPNNSNDYELGEVIGNLKKIFVFAM